MWQDASQRKSSVTCPLAALILLLCKKWIPPPPPQQFCILPSWLSGFGSYKAYASNCIVMPHQIRNPCGASWARLLALAWA